MDMRQLDQFVTLARTLNYRKAAESLHMTQPPLSASIRRLEERWGALLFTRTRRGTELTPSGLAALEDAKRALFHAQQACRAAQAAATGEAGMLRLGFVGSATYGLMPRVIPLFRRRHPQVQLQLVESTTARITAMLEAGDLEAGLVRVPLAHACKARIVLIEHDEFVAALPLKSRLARRRKLALADLRDEPFVMYSASMVPGLHGAVLLACQRAGFVPRVQQEAVQVPTLVSLVESGLGVALVPSVATNQTNPRVVIKHLVDSDRAAIGLALALPPGGSSGVADRLRECLLELTRK